jgi:hypothetical protein
MAETKKREEYILTKAPKTVLQEKLKDMEVPVYLETVEFTEEQKSRIKKEIKEEMEAIKDERDGEKLDQKFDALDDQYEGKLPEDTMRQFNLTCRITMQHEDRIVNNIMEAFLDMDPRFSIGPRPGFEAAGGTEVCEKQSDFLDDRLDYLPYRPEAEKVVRSSVRKGVGILKIYHHIHCEKRRREEEYIGKVEVIGMDKNNMPIMENKGLKQFLENWPEAEKDYPGLVKQLKEEKTINIIAEYKETVYNDAKFRHVDNKNFYCRLATEGYEGLKTTRLTGERISMTWWELQQAEFEKKFTSIDELTYDGKDKDKKTRVKGYENKSYDIMEYVYYFKMKEEDEEPTKLVCWVAEEKDVVLGGILYPFYAIDCYYVPHYIKHTKAGFYQAALAEDMSDDEYAAAIFLNSALEGAYISNLVTPITPEDSDVDKQFNEKRFVQGLPINAKPGEIDFLQKYMKPTNVGEMFAILQYLKQGVSDKTGISSGSISGRADPLDPNAPARKTAMLLQESNKNMRAYVFAIGPAFNTTGDILLQLYYQISKEGRKFRQRRSEVANSMPFAEISRNELGAHSIIEVRAYQFDFDKQNEKQVDLALYQIVRQEPLIAGEPESVHLLLKSLLKSWSPKWKHLVNQILPPIEQVKQAKLQMAIQAVAQYIEAKKKEAEMMGQPMTLKMEELMPLIQQMTQELATPPSEEVQKERKQAAKKGQP